MAVKVTQEARYTIKGRSGEIRVGDLMALVGSAEDNGWDPDNGKVTVTVDKGVVTLVAEFEEQEV